MPFSGNVASRTLSTLVTFWLHILLFIVRYWTQIWPRQWVLAGQAVKMRVELCFFQKESKMRA